MNPGYTMTMPPMVSAWTKSIGLMGEDVAGTPPASATPAGVIKYVPVVLPAGCVARRVWWANGTTTTGGATVSVGIYANSDYGPGALLISGSATQGTASEVQFVDVTDTALSPGLWWLALCFSTTTNTTVMRSTTSASFDAAVLFMESGTTLPATATPVENTSAIVELFGFATTASP